MTLQGLRYFVAAAEYGSFTKAAQKCFVSQPALSRGIADLEQEMSRPLFRREKKRVFLTEAGEIFLNEARGILRRADSLTARMQAVGNGALEPVCIGYIVFGHIELFRRKCRELDGCPPGEELETRYCPPLELMEGLKAHRVDLAILSALRLPSLPPHECICLARSGVNAIVPRGNPLFGRKDIRMADLRGMPLIGYDPVRFTEMNQVLETGLQGTGAVPVTAGTICTLGDLVYQVSSKNAVGFCDDSVRYIETEDIRLIPIADGDAHAHDIMLVRLLDSTNRNAENLFDRIAKVCP